MSVTSTPFDKQVKVGRAMTDYLHRSDVAVWRRGDAAKHIGPPAGLINETWSQLWSTRCGLGSDAGPWMLSPREQNDDLWCEDCVRQAMLPYEHFDD